MRRINRLNLTSIILGVLITAILLLSESGFVRVLPDVPMLQWSKTYSANEAYSLTQTCDGGFALAGVNATYSPQSRGYVDYLPVLIKTNAEAHSRMGKDLYKRDWSSQYGISDALIPAFLLPVEIGC